jgi:hypothetical protein
LNREHVEEPVHQRGGVRRVQYTARQSGQAVREVAGQAQEDSPLNDLDHPGLKRLKNSRKHGAHKEHQREYDKRLKNRAEGDRADEGLAGERHGKRQ